MLYNPLKTKKNLTPNYSSLRAKNQLMGAFGREGSIIFDKTFQKTEGKSMGKQIGDSKGSRIIKTIIHY